MSTYGTAFVVDVAGDPPFEPPPHRRYVLNADPDDPDGVQAALDDLEGDPRKTDIAGPDAADAAAHLFGVSSEPVLEAELGSTSAWEEIGVTGGPFPWWDALALPWPVPPDSPALDW